MKTFIKSFINTSDDEINQFLADNAKFDPQIISATIEPQTVNRTGTAVSCLSVVIQMYDDSVVEEVKEAVEAVGEAISDKVESVVTNIVNEVKQAVAPAKPAAPATPAKTEVKAG